jgi:hypothetical protein
LRAILLVLIKSALLSTGLTIQPFAQYCWR